VPLVSDLGLVRQFMAQSAHLVFHDRFIAQARLRPADPGRGSKSDEIKARHGFRVGPRGRTGPRWAHRVRSRLIQQLSAITGDNL